MKKALSFLLALVMALSLLPTAVWAEGEASAGAEAVSDSFFDSSHPFTWDGKDYVWRFGWNGPDKSRGEWHLYAAPEGTSADSTGGWTDCGAEAVPFTHLTENTLAYAAACAMQSAWEDYEGSEKVPADLSWLITMMSYETVAYTEEDATAAQNFMSSHKIGTNGLTATLVLPNSTIDDLLNAWYGTTAAVRAALQKKMHCKLEGTEYLYNFTQLLHRTLKAGNDQGSSGDDGVQDNIVSYSLQDNGRTCIIEKVDTTRYSDNPVELGVNWRDSMENVRLIGITPEAVRDLANAGRNTWLYARYGIFTQFTPAILKDIFTKLDAISDGEDDLLWIRADYRNCDASQGSAYAFRNIIWLGDDGEHGYTAPTGCDLMMGLDTERVTPEGTEFVVYTPNDDGLVPRSDLRVLCDKVDNGNHEMYTVFAPSGGVFVVAPKDYQMQQTWPWYGIPTPPWKPSDNATTPDNAVQELETLYDSGFKFPVIGEDVHFVFPEQLKEWTEGCGDDWDYRFTVDESKGRVTIEVNMGSRDRWEDAVRNIETGGLDDGVFFRYYFGDSDNQRPMTYGFDWYGDYDGRSLANNALYQGYNHNNGLRLATVNRQNAHSSTLTLNSQGEDWRIILAMSSSKGNVADAEAKYAFQLEILPCEDISFSLPTENGTAVPAARLHPTATHSDWMTTVPADGSVFLRTVEGKTLNNAGSGQYGLIGNLNVDAPEGYTLKEWRNSSSGGSGKQFPVPLFRDDQVVTLVWQKDNAPDLVEYVRAESMNYLAWFHYLGDESAPASTPSANEFLSADDRKKLSDNGITVTYDAELGYFTTSVDASKLTDLSLLRQCFTPQAPENAAYFRFTGFGGSENPATHTAEERINTTMEWFNNADTALYSVDPDRPVRMRLMNTEELQLGDKTVYYSSSQSYNSLIIQWLNKEKEVIGYTCLYGRNGDLSTTVDTATVDTAPTDEVSVPTLVGTDLELLCDRNPQTEDGKRLFLLFNVTGEGQLGADGAEIYLPYSYFNLTKEEGLALADKGAHPLIRHYLNENCTEKESLLGEYTAAGVRIVTRSFSPFLIDAGGCTVGDLNGDGEVNELDMQALYENLSTGSTTEKLSDKDDFRLLADYNGDGAVDILDYQKLYQSVKTA